MSSVVGADGLSDEKGEQKAARKAKSAAAAAAAAACAGAAQSVGIGVGGGGGAAPVPDQTYECSSAISASAVDESTGWLALGLSDGSVCVYSNAIATVRHILSKHNGPVTALTFCGQKFLVTGGRDATVHVYALSDGACIFPPASLPLPGPLSYVKCLSSTPLVRAHSSGPLELL
jgi:WD40 repeat protein